MPVAVSIAEEIEELKRERNAVLLAHHYQESEIQEYITSGLGGEKTQVMIKAEGDVRYGEVERIRQAISGALEDGQLIQIGVHQ